MIYVGDNEITNIYIGADEIYGIYAGDLQIYPTDFGSITAITISGLTWVTDVPASGGTADSGNCSFKVIALYDSGKSRNVTKDSTISGSLVVPSTTAETREMVGTLTLTATYSGFTASASVDAYQQSAFIPYENRYLTFNVTSAGNIRWVSQNASYTKTIEYSTNNGSTWNSITSTSAGVNINVNVGDKVMLRGNNGQYAPQDGRCTTFSASTAGFTLEGNIMSLVYGDNFIGQTALISANTFMNFFNACTGMTSAENLILPATTLTNNCYQGMLANCTSLTKTPELPATVLTTRCYGYLFYRSTNVNYIKCLAQSHSNDNTYYWINGVQTNSGTFVKNPNASWGYDSNNNVPRNWTIIDNS